MKRIQLLKKATLAAAVLLCMAGNVSAGWTQKAGVNTPGPGRWGSLSFTLGGKIYVGGGYVGNFTNTNDWQVYDPVANQWSYLANMPGANSSRTAGVAFVLNGKGFAGLGAQDYNNFSPAPTYLNDIWEYNASSDNWTKKADFPDSGRSDATCFTIGAKAYVVGGKTGPAATSNDTWEYDAATNQWNEKADFPGTLERGAGFAVGSKGYVVGGSLNGAATNKLYEYDPATDKWTEKAAYPETEITGPLAFVANNRAYVGLGGVQPFSASANYPKYFWSYSPATDKWSYAGGFEMTASGRMYGIAAVTDTAVYIGAGWRLDNSANQTFFFDFHTINPVKALGISSINNGRIEVYPNPVKDKLYIAGDLSGASYQLCDMHGRTVHSGAIQGAAIDVSALAPGVYVLTIVAEQGNLSKTIVKE